MRISNIQSAVSNQYALNSKKKAVNFTATPEQIIYALHNTEMCPGKADFLNCIAKVFKDIQKCLKNTDIEHVNYKIGQVNDVPKAFINKKEGEFWQGADKIFSELEISSESGSHSNCAKGETKGDFAKNLLQKLNVENPSEITLKRPEKKKFLFFSY